MQVSSAQLAELVSLSLLNDNKMTDIKLLFASKYHIFCKNTVLRTERIKYIVFSDLKQEFYIHLLCLSSGMMITHNLVPRLLSTLPVPSRCERTLVLSGHVISARLPYEVGVGRLITFVSKCFKIVAVLFH